MPLALPVPFAAGRTEQLAQATAQQSFSTGLAGAAYTRDSELAQQEFDFAMTGGTLTRDLQRTRANSPVVVEGSPQSLSAQDWSTQFLAAQNTRQADDHTARMTYQESVTSATATQGAAVKLAAATKATTKTTAFTPSLLERFLIPTEYV